MLKISSFYFPPLNLKIFNETLNELFLKSSLPPPSFLKSLLFLYVFDLL